MFVAPSEHSIFQLLRYDRLFVTVVNCWKIVAYWIADKPSLLLISHSDGIRQQEAKS